MKLSEIWKNKEKILEGLTNTVFKNDFVENVAEHRNRICKACPHIDNKGDSCFLPGTQPCCNLCGCSLILKQRALSAACDDGRWEAILTEEEEDRFYNQNLDEDGNPISLD